MNTFSFEPGKIYPHKLARETSGLTENAFVEGRRSGELNFVRRGHAYLYRSESLLAWLSPADERWPAGAVSWEAPNRRPGPERSSLGRDRRGGRDRSSAGVGGMGRPPSSTGSEWWQRRPAPPALSVRTQISSSHQ